MPAYIKEWEKLNLKFDGICTGFLGSHKQIEIVRYFFDIFKTPDNIVVVDPVMGDYGNLYATYTKETCEEMKKLVSYANILTPNLTEACILTGREYNAEYGNEELEIINFISEYRNSCEQDINHLPVVERNAKELKLKSFAVCRDIFED